MLLTFVALSAALLAACCGSFAQTPSSEPTLEDATAPQTLRVPLGKTVDVPLPAFEAKPGKAVLLRFGAVAAAEGPAGCNFNMTATLNGAGITRRTGAGDERLIGRPATFRFTTADAREFPVFSGPRLMLMYAPDTATANGMTQDDLGGTFLLDVSDIVSGVDGNTLSIANTRPAGAKGTSDVLIEALQIGWVDRDALPKPKIEIPTRGPIAREVSVAGVRLAQGEAGGFTVSAGGTQLLVETGVGMGDRAPALLLAQDEQTLDEPSGVQTRQWGPEGFALEASLDSFRLERTIQVLGGLVQWKERWINTTDQTRGLAFRHYVFLRDEAARFTLSGDRDVDALAGCATNPTLFLESPKDQGGFGVTAESDWLRLLMSLRTRAGVGQVYSKCLALPPEGAIDFELSIAPVSDEGGYYSFINGVRERWGVNGVTMNRPMFWGYARAEGENQQDVLRKSLGHLGPIYVTCGGWMRLTADAVAARTGKYPRLPEGAPAAPGKCPELDAEAFTTFKHREAWWDAVASEMAALKRACPDAKPLNITHPAMEVVYAPLADRFPIASEAIRTAAGEPFSVYHYNRAHLYGAADLDWAVYYYSPRPGSDYLKSILQSCRRSMDSAGSDGVYCDEFSWAGRSRGYSRYDYSRWDGYSADLDDEGNVLRLKSDNAHVSEPSQLQMTHECLSRGKFFLGNGGSALRSINSLPIHRFIEGGNGHGTMAGGHLSAAPLVLGNFGDQKTRTGVFSAVKQCLSIGCLYSPTAVNLLLEGADNFVCKLYPMTVQRIGPGYIMGRDRLATTCSGEFGWPGRDVDLRLYRYSNTGDLLDEPPVVHLEADEPFVAQVPEGGLLIAELTQTP